jgi:RHS repeat-associated protein
VPVRYGSVDAVSGALHLQIPVSPKLPGRIPVGFNWSFNSQRDGAALWSDSNGSDQPGPGSGGHLAPVQWPDYAWDVLNPVVQNSVAIPPPDLPPTLTVTVQGEPWTFYGAWNPSNASPSRAGKYYLQTGLYNLPSGDYATAATALKWMHERGVDDGYVAAQAKFQADLAAGAFYSGYTPTPLRFTIRGAYQSTDGTKVLLLTEWVTKAWDAGGKAAYYHSYTPQYVVLYGPNAVWGPGGPRHPLPWVAHFTNRWGDSVSVFDQEQTINGNSYTTLTFQNDRSPSESITATELPTGGIQITNTLGLPTETLDAGNFIYGAMPTTIKTTASNGESATLTLNWGTNPLIGPDLNGVTPKVLQSITHPNGLLETFTSGGLWADPSVIVIPSAPAPTAKWLGVTQVTFKDQATGQGQSVLFTRPSQPWNLWTSTHVTTVVTVPSVLAPGSSWSGDYRGVKLTHPALPASPSITVQNLVRNSVILMREAIHGTGLGADGTPSSPTVDETSLFDGWDFRSYLDPTGSTATCDYSTQTFGIKRIYPATATRIQTFAPNLPTRTTIIARNDLGSSRDAYGPVQTDSWSDAPSTPPAITSLSGGLTMFNAIAAPTNKPTHRTGIQTRHWNADRFLLQTDTDAKALDGTGLQGSQALRNDATLMGVGSVDFGTSKYGFDAATGLVNSVTGTRGAYTASEARTYGVTDATTSLVQPLVTRMMKTLTDGSGNTYLPVPSMPSIQAGHEYQYDQTSYHWLQKERDLIDGRWTTYVSDQMGRVTLKTDGFGIQTSYAFDAWGRPSQEVQHANLPSRRVTTTHTYDPNSLWIKETVTTAEGKTITKETDLDGFGRVMTVLTYLGTDPTKLLSKQTFSYDGFGQKIAQTPVLKGDGVGNLQTSWGNETFSYDGKGRLVSTFDAKGRRTMYQPNDPTWDPAQGTTGGMVTTVYSPGPMVVSAADSLDLTKCVSRTEVHDHLGQKIKVIDQAGQAVSYFYDKDGHLLQTQQGVQVRKYQYNDLGWLLSRSEPEEGTTVFSNFTLAGTPLKGVITGTGGGTITSTTTLNGWALPSSTLSTDGTNTVARSFGYDATTHLLNALDEEQPNGVLLESYGYDDLFRLSAKTVSDGTQKWAFSRTMDSVGGETSLTYPAAGGRASQTVTTTFDAQNRPNSVSLDGVLRGNMAYESAIMSTSVIGLMTYRNGAAGLATTTTTMDRGELVHLTHVAAGSTLEDDAVNWSAAGLLLNRGTDSYTYDSLQRLSYANVMGVQGESTQQWFTYDVYGNRATSDFVYAAGPNAISKPTELMAWSNVANGATNALPTSITSLVPGSAKGVAPGTSAGTLNTGAVYDGFGRMTSVYDLPGASTAPHGWTYDPGNRVVTESFNGVTTKYLLDGEGLRFKRQGSDGGLQYTLYGFHRDPLMVLKMTTASPLTLAKTMTTTTTKLMATATLLPIGAVIDQPTTGSTFTTGSSVQFSASYTDFPPATIAWTFGDGGTGSGYNVAHTYVTPGTYTAKVTMSKTGYATSSATVRITIVAAPPGPQVTSFASNPSLISPGQNAVLSWSVANATTLTVSPGNVNVTGTSSLTVSPTATTTYTLTATNVSGTVSSTTTVTVQPLPIISSFTATATSITPSQTTTLNWAISNANTVSMTETMGGVTTDLGAQQGTSVTVSPSLTTTYTLIATNPMGTVSSTLTITLTTTPTLAWQETLVYGFGTLLSEEKPEGTFYVIGDQVGSPNYLLDTAGVVKGRSKNLPFGERLSSTGSAKSLRRYTNHEDQPGSPIYMQARMYLPIYGRFAEVDPIYDQTKGDPETWNLYGYVTNNPVTHTDPDGRSQISFKTEEQAKTWTKWRGYDHLISQGTVLLFQIFQVNHGPASAMVGDLTNEKVHDATADVNPSTGELPPTIQEKAPGAETVKDPGGSPNETELKPKYVSGQDRLAADTVGYKNLKAAAEAALEALRELDASGKIDRRFNEYTTYFYSKNVTIDGKNETQIFFTKFQEAQYLGNDGKVERYGTVRPSDLDILSGGHSHPTMRGAVTPYPSGQDLITASKTSGLKTPSIIFGPHYELTPYRPRRDYSNTNPKGMPFKPRNPDDWSGGW